MLRKTGILFLIIVFLAACGANRESPAVRAAEQQQRQLERKAEHEHAKMKRQHYHKQRKETRKTLRGYERRAKKMNRSKRFHPYIWYFQTGV